MRRTQWLLPVLIVAGVLALTLVASRVYPAWNQKRLLRQGGESLAQSDLHNAYLSLRRVVESNPSNIEACKMMAELAEKANTPQAIYWHRRLVELEPNVLEHALHWGRAALQYGEFALAEQALESINKPGRETAVYHHLAASVALAQNHHDLAEFHSAEALRLAPTNQMFELNLAAIRLQSTNDALAQQARRSLENLRTTSRFHCEALRNLIADAFKNHDTDRAISLSQELQTDPGSIVSDRTRHLFLLQTVNSPEFGPYFGEVKRQVSKKPQDIFALCTWLIADGRAKECLPWLRSLPEAMQEDQSVQMAIADCLSALKDWPGVETYLRDKLWEELEFLRLAALARTHKEQGNPPKSQVAWNSAVKAASRRPDSLFMLLRVATAWRWQTERIDLLWAIGRGRTNPRWALQDLYRYYQSAGDTRGLYRVLLRMLEINPTDDIAKNNLVHLSLLLKVDVAKAQKTALELYHKHPANPIFASTYAFALHEQGRADQGLKVLNSLQEAELREPAVAAYYAILLSAEGTVEQARKYFGLAKNASLLPEEKALILKAQQTLNLL